MSKTADNPSLTIVSEEATLPIPLDKLEEVAHRIYVGEEIPFHQNTDLIFCSKETIQDLNREYREKDSITDVISFPFNEHDYLGEIYICTERMKEQAQKYGFSLEEEALRLFVHGLFHIQGYDHIQEEERVIMEKKERTYFSIDYSK